MIDKKKASSDISRAGISLYTWYMSNYIIY
uniref:Uncharacterized protein n=1 Tax=Myoviridae sp. ctZ2t4 TaxID=2827693 RepID=A0A8S5SRW7_9CAUD|nr:MAG TPA: hypothetical protein [Myoviridae sp. ctZ2t4]